APAFARVVRGSALGVLSLPYVEAARSLGISDIRIILRHLLPNIMAPLIVLTTVYLSTAILTEAALSFLGLGTQPPEPSWGSMLNAARSYMERVVEPRRAAGVHRERAGPDRARHLGRPRRRARGAGRRPQPRPGHRARGRARPADHTPVPVAGGLARLYPSLAERREP